MAYQFLGRFNAEIGDEAWDTNMPTTVLAIVYGVFCGACDIPPFDNGLDRVDIAQRMIPLEV